MPYPRKGTPEDRAQRNRESAARFYRENKAHAHAQSAAYAKAHPERRKQYKRTSYYRNIEKRWLDNYGIGVADYEAMLVAQRGLCAVCGERPRDRRLSIDHDHATNRVRGLLHSNCNTLLGLAGDNPSVLIGAATYLAQGIAA